MKASELKKGMIIKEGGDFFIVVDIEHRTPGNKRAIYQTTLKDLLNPRTVNRRYSPTDTIEDAELESKRVQYMFRDHAGFHFMDMATYETLVLPDDMVGDSRYYLKENLEVEALYHEHHPVTIELPVSVDLKVSESAPGIRGDTTGKAMKSATLETGSFVDSSLVMPNAQQLPEPGKGFLFRRIGGLQRCVGFTVESLAG
ncbi:MAG: hypothetical protein PHP46_03830, partial [Candidatus Omnitrophica bacterium]|nr:hypothetical protein [Candidatus Omnitrophota bacterium]